MSGDHKRFGASCGASSGPAGGSCSQLHRQWRFFAEIPFDRQLSGMGKVGIPTHKRARGLRDPCMQLCTLIRYAGSGDRKITWQINWHRLL